MKGLELSERFFGEVGLPRIKEKLPESVEVLAAGISGGSQCHGNDDEISRDHGWGPGFQIWLTNEDFKKFNKSLKTIIDELPREYLEHSWGNSFEETCSVDRIENFIKEKLGVSAPPLNDADWMIFREEQLFEITHTAIFYDGKGEVTRTINEFKYYPDDVWKKRLVKSLQSLWVWSVRHIQRAVQRNDLTSARLLWGNYSDHVMRVGFLLNREFAPYEKWRYVQFKKLSEFGDQIGDLIVKGLNRPQDMFEITEKIEEIYIDKLKSLGYESIKITNPPYANMRLQEYALGINETIENQEIKFMGFNR